MPPPARAVSKRIRLRDGSGSGLNLSPGQGLGLGIGSSGDGGEQVQGRRRTGGGGKHGVPSQRSCTDLDRPKRILVQQNIFLYSLWANFT